MMIVGTDSSPGGRTSAKNEAGNGDERQATFGWPAARSRQLKISERIAHELAQHIITNDLPEGTKLPPEREMLESIGVGRTTLREALRLLESRGVITIRSGPGGGPSVRRPQPRDLSEALTLILQFEKASMADILQAREALEPVVTALAMGRMTDEVVETLQKSVDTMLENLGDHDLFLEQNRIFHSTIAEASGSVALRIFLETLKFIADGAVVGVEYDAKRHRAVAESHQRILDAMRNGEREVAMRAATDHLEEASAYWHKRYAYLMDNPLVWKP
jgi:DNA-binding FadR family transcriptional regulator